MTCDRCGGCGTVWSERPWWRPQDGGPAYALIECPVCGPVRWPKPYRQAPLFGEDE